MRKFIKIFGFAALISVLVLPPFAISAGAGEHYKDLDEKGGYMIADLLVIRPMGIVATTVGSIFYVVSLPFSVAGGNQEEAYEKMVLEPARYTFTRPLGSP